MKMMVQLSGVSSPLSVEVALIEFFPAFWFRRKHHGASEGRAPLTKRANFWCSGRTSGLSYFRRRGLFHSSQARIVGFLGGGPAHLVPPGPNDAEASTVGPARAGSRR